MVSTTDHTNMTPAVYHGLKSEIEQKSLNGSIKVYGQLGHGKYSKPLTDCSQRINLYRVCTACHKALFFLFLGLRILRPKFLHFRKKLKFYF